MNTVLTDTDAKDFVKSDLTPERWEHTLGVVELAERLAESYDIEADPLRAAALFHDNARELPKDRQRDLAGTYRNGLDDVEEAVPGLWHAPAGAQRVLENFEYHPSDPVVRAVAFHTTARPNPSNCLMALFVADFAEPNRDHPEADTIRSMVGEPPLRDLVKRTLNHKLRRTLETGGQIHPRSIECWNQPCE